MTERYFAIHGPEKFEETILVSNWMKISHWAKETIVSYSENQPPDKPGSLFRIVWKPKTAPENAKSMRLPNDWVIEIPCFNTIEYEQGDGWAVEKGPNGILNVVKR